MGLLDGILGGATKSTSGVGASATSGVKGGGVGFGEEAVSQVAKMIVDYAFASSIKKDQKRFQKEIAKLDAKKQAELLDKVQKAQTELQRQEIVYLYIDKSRFDELKAQGKKERTILYVGLGVGVLIYGFMIINLRKK